MKTVEDIRNDYNQTLTLLKQAESSSDWKTRGELSKRKDDMQYVLDMVNKLEEIKNRLTENEGILNTYPDEELAVIAREEKTILLNQRSKLEQEIQAILNKKEEAGDYDSIILEIRAGTGGEEAALFAANLLNMYLRYADLKGWQTQTLDSDKTEIGGIKEAVIEIRGDNAYAKMKYEGGVHRVQRIPDTEKAGRIHTSTVAVAILPKPKKSQISLRADDLRVENYHSSGPGGQYVNKRETAVRITHIPTGVVVACQTSRNQAQNKENALAILEARILKIQDDKQNASQQKDRKSQVGKMERAEKIRTYNYPQDRITDHRIKKTWHNIQAIMQGNLDEIIEELERGLV